ncbi:hypothetical protein GCM10020370_71560 [Paenibacillus hodogayensis]
MHVFHFAQVAVRFEQIVLQIEPGANFPLGAHDGVDLISDPIELSNVAFCDSRRALFLKAGYHFADRAIELDAKRDREQEADQQRAAQHGGEYGV